MLPMSPDFVPATGTLVFLGVFYAVLATVAVTLAVALFRSWRTLASGKAGHLLLEEQLSELPGEARRCRHALTGETPGRTCARAFDCKGCETHARLLAAAEPSPGPVPVEVAGLSLPDDRLYHRGHAWARPEPDGSVTVGLDDFGSRLVGTPDAVELPRVGSTVLEHGPAFRLRKGSARVRIASPVGGTVVETGGPGRPFFLRVRPDAPFDGRSLLCGREAAAWLLGELDRLQLALSRSSGVPALADGGLPEKDLSAAIPEKDRDRVLAELLLEG